MAMSPVMTIKRREAVGAGATLEERLHRARATLALVSDLFALHAAAPQYARSDGLSGPASEALADLCSVAAADLRDLLSTLPGDVLNWSEEPRPKAAGSRRGDQ